MQSSSETPISSGPRSIAESANQFKDLFNMGKAFADAAWQMNSYANQFNVQLGQGRQRMSELMIAVSDATPNVIRLGGEIKDVSQTIVGIAEASRRSVVANTEDIEQMFAASKILGQEVKSITDKFLDVGIQVPEIYKDLGDSMKFINSIGGNTKQVMGDVLSNMDKMNRFQFENGVQGITKMAAQASMLRFNMQETFNLAERVLDPDEAIKVASAFQRLGVNIGNLADPFQLMNQSINDPSGLQTSLAELTKRFTYFDEKTKSFKINPEGVLTFKELQGQIGVSSTELSKMALAGAELDARLADINRAGLKFASEEDKQYLANIANLSKDGKYQVTLEDGTKQELAKLTQPEFDRLIDEQKKAPKTMEDIARNQYNTIEILAKDLRAIRDKILFGITSSAPIRETFESYDRISRSLGGSVSKNIGSVKGVRDTSEKTAENLKDIIGKIMSGEDTGSLSNTLITAFKPVFDNLGGNFSKAFENIKADLYKDPKNEKFVNEALKNISTVISSLSAGSGNNNFLNDILKKINTPISGSRTNDTMFGSRPISSLVYGGTNQANTNTNINLETNLETITDAIAKLMSEKNPQIQNIVNQAKTGDITLLKEYIEKTTNIKNVSDVQVGGNINIKLSLPDNFNQVDKQKLTQLLEEVFKSPDFQRKIKEISESGKSEIPKPGK